MPPRVIVKDRMPARRSRATAAEILNRPIVQLDGISRQRDLMRVVAAKLYRLLRDVHFISGLMAHQRGGRWRSWTCSTSPCWSAEPLGGQRVPGWRRATGGRRGTPTRGARDRLHTGARRGPITRRANASNWRARCGFSAARQPAVLRSARLPNSAFIVQPLSQCWW
jgi:hypothetical protein